jgi:hypothetical protein
VKTDAFKWGNGFGCVCGIAWAYTSYKYNWLNVGGGESDLKEVWIAASGVVPYIALIFWLAAIVLVAAQEWQLSLTGKTRIYRIAITVLITPAALFISDWLFHIGFPRSPV